MTLTADLASQLWRVSPAAMARHLSRWEPYRFEAPAHILLVSDAICDAVAGRAPRLIITLPPRHGKPLDISTPILMADGSIKPLADIVVGDCVITSHARPQQVLAVHEQGDLPCVRITTQSGREVVSALDHPFLTARGWLKAGELSQGDVLALLPAAQVRPSTSKLDVEFRMAGYFVGDGSTGISKMGVLSCNITCFDEDVKRDIEACANQLGWFWRWSKKGRIDFRKGSGQPRQWLRDNGLAGRLSPTKRVPDWVFSSSPEQISHFLSSYFLCDGTINRRGQQRRDACFEFYSVNKALLEDVRHLLLRLGVKSRLSFKNGRYLNQKHQSYRLTISSVDDVDAFLSFVPLLGQKLMKAVSWGVKPSRFRGSYLEDPVVRVEPLDTQRPCRCLTVEEDSTFLANDLVVHNSEQVSKWLPFWYLNSWPQKHVMLCGYGADFAATWGRAVRNKAKYHEDRVSLRLADDSKAAGRWNTSEGGGMVATGVGGDITGRGADCLIVDDPVKNWQEANSLVYRDMVWDWWQTTARTRLHPGGAIVVCMTRWHSDDLVGRLLAKAQADPGADQWRVINLPAEAEPGDPLERLPGQPLWPERYDAAALRQIKASVGIEAWESLYQQHPLDLVAHGNVYRSFGQDNVEPCSFDPRLPLCWSLDFNVDPMCSVLAQIQEQGSWIATLTGRAERTLRVLREISLADATTIDACQEFLSLTAPWLDDCRKHRTPFRVRVYGDRSGQSRKTSGVTDYELIRQFFRGRPGYSVTFHLQKANPAVRDRVNAVNAMLCDASGTRHMYIDPSCRALTLDLQRVRWKRDSSNNVTGQIDKSDQSLTHVSDALGYLVEREFGLKGLAGGRPGILQ